MKNKLFLLVFVFLIVLAGGYFVNQKYYVNKNETTILTSPPIVFSPSILPSSKVTITPADQVIPSSYLIKNFPFQSQAPLGNWDALHEEACEEASLILVKYWQGGKSISAQTMEDEIQKMVSWEGTHGYSQDDTVAELAQIATDYYGMSKPKVQYSITIDDIKKAISENHPVIIPAAGRLLGNPNFTAPGPIYHMVVVIGYSGNTIIVQDVGTRRGDNYEYNQTIFFNAIHDWAGSKDNITSGRKAILVF